MNDVLTLVSLVIMGLGLVLIPFAPLLMWYITDDFEILDIDETDH